MSEERDFLGRWSARKLKARAGEAADPVPTVPCGALPAGPELPEKTDLEILDELGLPDPDSLLKGDDFKAFMRAAVPARIRNRALRKLWLTDPVFANLDGLNDYEQDFSDAATAMPVLESAYRVGRGLLRAEPEPPEAENAAACDGAPEDSPEVSAAAGGAGPERSDPPPAAEQADAEPISSEEGPEPAGPARRRMRFRFDAG